MTEHGKVICPDCGADMILRQTQKYRYKGGEGRKFFGCSRYPACTSIHNADPQGRPIGVPGDKETKALRMVAHREAEMVWGPWKSEQCRKAQMYAWLKKNTKTGHIGDMTKEDLPALIEKLKILPRYDEWNDEFPSGREEDECSSEPIQM